MQISGLFLPERTRGNKLLESKDSAKVIQSVLCQDRVSLCPLAHCHCIAAEGREAVAENAGEPGGRTGFTTYTLRDPQQIIYSF